MAGTRTACRRQSPWPFPATSASRVDNGPLPTKYVLDEVAIIKIIPDSIRGKYKIGQNLRKEERIDLAKKINERNTPSAKETLKIMGFEITKEGLRMVDEPVW